MDDVVLQLEGEGISPDAVSIGDLSYILDRLNRAILSVASERGTIATQLRISLVDIKPGSSVYVMPASVDARTHAGFVIEAIDKRDGTLLPQKARRCIEEIHGRTKKRQWAFRMQERKASQVLRHAYVLPTDKLFDKPATRGATSLAARIIKAGGELGSLGAEIKLPTGEKITARVKSLKLVQSLGELLHQTVELHGRATWSSEDYKVREFRIDSIGEFREEDSDPIKGLDELRKVVGGFWESVRDVDSHLNELRHGIGECEA